MPTRYRTVSAGFGKGTTTDDPVGGGAVAPPTAFC